MTARTTLWTHLLAAGLAAALLVARGAPAVAEDLRVDPAQPFGAIDLNVWYLAEYLSGSQKDDARLLFMRRLPDEQMAELAARCDVLKPLFANYEDNVRLVCESAWSVINSR